ncbi:hypothetical protein ADL25_44640 [Streptomyces sp. NRRL F-5122]|nr:hypothetical protein ADL25_44640 [Streptomyces sp. NRRL F-5122]
MLTPEASTAESVLPKVAQFVHTERSAGCLRRKHPALRFWVTGLRPIGRVLYGVSTRDGSPFEQLDQFLHLLWRQAAAEVLRQGLQFAV